MSIPHFNFSLIQLLCQELKTRILNAEVLSCAPHNLSQFFFIFKSLNQECLFFCFSPPFIRFHFISHIPSFSTFHPLQAFLEGAFLEQASVLQQDRILQLTFHTKKGERLFFTAEFFAKHPNYYLTDSNNEILFSLHPSKEPDYQLPKKFPTAVSPASWKSHREVEVAYKSLEKEWQFEKEKQTFNHQLSRQLKKQQKKQQLLALDLDKCLKWHTVQHQGELIKAHLNSISKGAQCIVVYDWEIDQSYSLMLDPLKSAQEQMAIYFRQAKKLQKGIIPIQSYLEEIKKEIITIQDQLQKLDNIQTIEDLRNLKEQMRIQHLIFPKTSFIPPSPIFREYQSAKGIKIWVGKSAKANDQLTFQLANGRDWWLHISGYPGSHVIIKSNQDQQPDFETLQDAMQLALYYSKAKQQGEGEICFTQRKYVSRLKKGKPGLVQIAKHQTAWVKFDNKRYEDLKKRQKQRL